jgi:hypothetical protein
MIIGGAPIENRSDGAKPQAIAVAASHAQMTIRRLRADPAPHA